MWLYIKLSLPEKLCFIKELICKLSFGWSFPKVSFKQLVADKCGLCCKYVSNLLDTWFKQVIAVRNKIHLNKLLANSVKKYLLIFKIVKI